jgi:hypothetical protein
MELISVSCNHCGAPLEVGEETKFVTCKFCKNQLAVRHTASAAYTEVMEQIAESTQELTTNLRVIELQNELERVDREWETEKKQYMVTGKDGSQSEPSMIGSVVGLLFLVGFGIFWIGTAASMGAPGIFPIFGVIIVLGGVISIVSALSKASRFPEAEAGYRERRSAVLQRLDAARAARG